MFRSMHTRDVNIMSNSGFRILVLLISLTVQASGAAAGLPLPNCTETCGNVTIPFPFGIGAGCFLDDWYEIVCQQNTMRPILKKTGLQVLGISLPSVRESMDGVISVSLPLIYSNASCRPEGLDAPVNLEGSPFIFSQTRNVFTSVGCNTMAIVNSTESAVVGCRTKCAGTNTYTSNYSACVGRDQCCQTTLPFNLQGFSVDFKEDGGPQGCSKAFLADRSWLLRCNVTGLYDLSLNGAVPVVLEWGISNKTDYGLKLIQQGYDSRYDTFGCSRYDLYDSYEMPFTQCYCSWWYRGNPYLPGGCQDINECNIPNICSGRICVNKQGGYHCITSRKTAILIGVGAGLGALVLCLFLWRLYKYIKKRKEIKLKEKYFKRNGGLLLKSELSSPKGNVKKSKFFNSKDLEKATDNFNDDRILGQGGQGTVYKGMLSDGKIVAIKKSKVIDEGKVKPFINEVLILSQINHRNVVNLLGCCLETEVSLLVYEFIPNGTLYQYLHDPNQEFHVPWDTRLRIATEIAGALFYLHSAASIPIYHRDIKSTNILLDEKYRAKVADFGTSKLVSLDQTHVTTLVQGTFGYLDLEYFQSSQFTEKVMCTALEWYLLNS
ncbi:hypothetical protein BT93_K1358 [Corymbia citriodora subsp. variegata]|nr:hypothetical protein BT93_K1358 [Corymbia citriodora subsp. variegata]